MLPPRISVLLTCERIAAGSFSLEYRSTKRDKDNFFSGCPDFLREGLITLQPRLTRTYCIPAGLELSFLIIVIRGTRHHLGGNTDVGWVGIFSRGAWREKENDESAEGPLNSTSCKKGPGLFCCRGTSCYCL